MKNLEKLEKLLSEATAGPWDYSTCYGVAFIQDINKESVAHAVEYIKPKNDAELICALRNCAPLLLEIVKAAKAVSKVYPDDSNRLHNKLTDALKKFEEV